MLGLQKENENKTKDIRGRFELNMAKRIEAFSKDGRARMSIPTSGLSKAQIKQVKGWRKKIKKSSNK